MIESVRGGAVMVRRQLRVNRTSWLVIAVLVTVFSIAQIQAFATAFPDAATRTALLGPFINNGALRVLYGYPFDIGDVTGWVAWRSNSNVAIIMAVWALVITAGALRGEEDTGRGELALSQPQPRVRWFAATLAATTIETIGIGALSVLGMAAVGIPQRLLGFANCLELGLQVVLPALLFAAVGALTSQIFGTVRGARIAAAGVLAVAFLLRAVADAGSGLTWLRWLTPLGWDEELRPPQAPSAVALLAGAAFVVVLAGAAVPMLTARDVGRGLLAQRDSRAPRRMLLGSPWQAALRDEAAHLASWLVATVALTALLGGLVKTVLSFLTENSRFTNLIGETIGVNAFVAAMFTLVQLVAALLTVALVVSARGEEATGRLELLLAAPRSRIGWLAGRVLLAVVSATVLTLAASVALWVGAAVTGERLDFGGLLAATGNSVPLIVITAGCVAAILGVAPRATAFCYALVGAAYLWGTLGTALRAPAWSLDLSPFHALALVPLEDFAPIPAIVLSLLGFALLALGLGAFRHRDLAAG